SNSAGTVPSNAATLTVNPPAVAPSITSQPSNQTVTAGQDAIFTVAANGTPSPTFQWQVSTDGGSNWNNLANDSTYSGVGTTTLTVTAAIIGQNGYRYRALATNTAGSASSSAAVLSVNAATFTVLAGQNFNYNFDVVQDIYISSCSS